MREPEPEVIRFLLERSADANARDDRGDPVLMEAVRRERLDIVQQLVEHGGELNAENSNGEAPLVYALKNGLDATAYGLLGLGAKPPVPLATLLDLTGTLNTPDDRGWTPLARAAREGKLARLQLLLAAGANAEMTADDGLTPLMVAVQHGNREIVTALLEHGAALAHRDSQGETALHHAVRTLQPEQVRALLAAGANVDAPTHAGVTPLMMAAQDCGTGIAQILLEGGADPDAEDAEGRTALFYAIRQRRPDLVTLLLSYGADSEYEDPEGYTPFDRASEANDEESARILSEFGQTESEPESDESFEEEFPAVRSPSTPKPVTLTAEIFTPPPPAIRPFAPSLLDGSGTLEPEVAELLRSGTPRQIVSALGLVRRHRLAGDVVQEAMVAYIHAAPSTAEAWEPLLETVRTLGATAHVLEVPLRAAAERIGSVEPALGQRILDLAEWLSTESIANGERR
jgi:ankyrin repeat protein